MNKKNVIGIALGILLLSISLLILCNKPNEYKENFVDNQKNEPYALNVPLHEMDLDVYSVYFIKNTAGIINNYKRNIELPCDIDYYASKEDIEPVFTLQKGTEVYVLPESERHLEGYGYVCWPDYDEGWRFGTPFMTEDFKWLAEDTEMYYVKSEQLEKVAVTFYKHNKRQLSELTSKEYQEWSTQYLDRILYEKGAYLSNYLLEN